MSRISRPLIRMSSRSFLRLRPRLAARHGTALVFVAAFCGIALATRLALLWRSLAVTTLDSSLLGVFAWGALFDLGTALLFAAPLVLLLTALPAAWLARRSVRRLGQAGLFALLALLIFGAVAEWVFWDEFAARFNFIAVDYLVYTHEVIGNIRESYPLPLILGGVAAMAAALQFGLNRAGLIAAPAVAGESRRRRWLTGGAWLLAAGTAGYALNLEALPRFADAYQRELAKNGLWSFFAAFRNNELDYDQFYATRPIDAAFANLRTELAADGSIPLGDAGRDTLRFVRNDGPELHPNVIQITVESLSADFLGTFNRASRLTRNLEALAAKSLVFENFYATGTRTDRGMEALTLAIPPTPGRSLVKRPDNANLFTLGSVFRSRGYDTAFLYGGFGYFDNMNAFFGQNGYRVIDRAAVAGSDITFANAWGACDEDLLRWTLREADAASARGQPFHFFVMTTSNHRPFTYPEGRIDLPPKLSGRAGAVKYTDFAIGEFLRAAESKPWFRDTIFVIVADHCASVAGKTELPVQNYHIPLFVYAPGGQVAPGRIKDLTSQVDYAPTLLGLLNWSYATRFYGWDVRRATGDRRALIGNYQRLGLYEPGDLVVLNPRRVVSQYAGTAESGRFQAVPPHAEEVDETIAYYQTASYLYRHRGYRALSAAEQQRAAAQAAASVN